MDRWGDGQSPFVTDRLPKPICQYQAEIASISIIANIVYRRAVKIVENLRKIESNESWGNDDERKQSMNGCSRDSLISNLSLFAAGVFCGALGYWVYDGFTDAPTVASTTGAEMSEHQQSGYRSERGTGSVRSGSTRTATTRLAERETFSTAGELRMAMDTVDPVARADKLRRAGAANARDDIERALEVGMSIEGLQDRLNYHRGLFGVWSDIDPETAVDFAKRSFNPGQMQSELIGLVVNKWGATNPQDARIWTEQNLSGPLRERALTDLMVGWTRRSPELASDWISQTRTGSAPLVSAVGTTWAEQDPEAAATWALQLPSSAARRSASVAVAVEWSRQSPDLAADFFSSEVAGPEGLDLATVIADIWGNSDPASTADWVAGLPEGDVRDQAAGVLATVWATRDVQAASEWTATIEDPSMRKQVIAHLGTTWGGLEPDQAIEWLAALPIEEAQAGLTGAFNSWAVVDQSGMRDWVESAQSSEVVDQARRSLADVVSQDNILSAIDLSMGISDPVNRADAVARYYRHWRKVDDASAQEWIGEVWNEIPAGLQSRLDRERAAKITPRN